MLVATRTPATGELDVHPRFWMQSRAAAALERKEQEEQEEPKEQKEQKEQNNKTSKIKKRVVGLGMAWPASTLSSADGGPGAV